MKYSPSFLSKAIILLGSASSLHAATQISSVTTILDTAVASQQIVPGSGSPGGTGFPAGTNYTINYGQIGDLRMTSFTAASTVYTINTSLQTNAHLRRNTASNPYPTNHQIAWYRQSSSEGNTRNLEASYVSSMESLLAGNIINRGTDNLFENTGNNAGNNNNVERIDFIFNGSDVLTPQNAAHLAGVGFTVLERGGNDPFYVSAILGIDAAGTGVTKLSAPARVESNDWGNGLWGSQQPTLVLRDTAVAGEYRPSATVTQDLFGMYFSLESMGVEVGDRVYGYAIMAGDTVVTDLNALLDWTNPNVFPTDTTSTNGGLDLVSGGSAFIEDDLDTTGLFSPIPEPSVALLGGIGMLVLLRRRR